MGMKAKIKVKGTEITVISKGDENDYISLTDIAKYKNPTDPRFVIQNWMRTRFTIEFLGVWEQLNNPNFNRVEFEAVKNESGSNAFVMTPTKWVDITGGIGVISKAGRYGGTFAHKDIAFEFASWISAEFKLYIIKDYQRLKTDENSRISLEWNVNRVISKINYKIHTDAIKDNLIPKHVSAKQQSFTYANEADMLNVALFGKTAKEWRDEHPESTGNMRDEATLQQLIVLSNLESMNAELIKQGIPQNKRLLFLNQMAIEQMKSIIDNQTVKQIVSTKKRI